MAPTCEVSALGETDRCVGPAWWNVEISECVCIEEDKCCCCGSSCDDEDSVVRSDVWTLVGTVNMAVSDVRHKISDVECW